MDRFKDWITQPRNAFGLVCLIAAIWLRTFPQGAMQQGERIEDIYFAAGSVFAIGLGCLLGFRVPK